ncbi:Altered inheritance of mitochondria protein 18 mitochondrial [Mortierella sp. AD094]|nr:Altered inheritance of mitochondria protein 18 mitochondrial [Mortierella sp. AD094]
MSTITRIVRMRALLAQQPTRNVARTPSFTPTSLRAPIHRHLGRTAVVTTTRAQDRWNPWMVATATAAGVLSWQLGYSMVEAESPAKSNVVVDPDSKVGFPLTIRSEDGSPARLLGLGVRKITFLKVQVYVVGLYAKESDLDDHNSRFRALPEVQKFQQTDQLMADAAFRAMVQTPIELILRIVPVRNTNGPHLRDGFTRSLTQSAKEQKLSEPENEEAMEGIMEFKALFPKGKINANQALVFRKSPDGSMTILLDNEVLGTLRNKWVIENFFLGYLNGNKPISEKARDSISQGIQDLLLQ